MGELDLPSYDCCVHCKVRDCGGNSNDHTIPCATTVNGKRCQEW